MPRDQQQVHGRLTDEEFDFYGQRLALLCEGGDELSRQFLDWYGAECVRRNVSVETAFDEWVAVNVEHGRPLIDSERRLLLFKVCFTPDNRRRLYLAKDGRPDRWTGVSERVPFIPTEHMLARLRFGGDLERGDKEPAEEYVHRVAVGFGLLHGTGGVRTMPDVSPAYMPDPRASEARLPYRDDAGQDDAEADGASAEPPAEEEPDPFAEG